MFVESVEGIYPGDIELSSPLQCHSMSSSLSSCDSQSSWDSSILMTPTSIIHPSSDTVKIEESYLASSASFYSPEILNSDSKCYPVTKSDAIHSFSSNMMLLEEQGMPSQNLMHYRHFQPYDCRMSDNTLSSQSHSSKPASLDLDFCSQLSEAGSSPVSVDFVVPSQTTFFDTFDNIGTHTPLSTRSFSLQYDGLPDFSADLPAGPSSSGSMAGNMPYFIPAYTECTSASITPSKPAQVRMPLFEGLPSSAALHRVQSQPSPQRALPSSAARLRQRRVKREDRIKKEDRVCKLLNTCNIGVQKEATEQCLVEGCGKRFQRREHLKRHERTHNNTENYPCKFCRKSFNRTDNLKQHLTIHMNPKKKARTEYFPEARVAFEAMSNKKRRIHSSRS